MSFTYVPTHPFYGGVGASSDVPGAWDIALNGRPYMLDTNHPAFGGQSAYLGRMGIDTIPMIRQQADSATEPGESTINPEDLWPRSQHSWHKGAGQEYLDNTDSDRARFRRSKGINVWERGKLSLLDDTQLVLGGLTSTPHLISAGGYTFFWQATTTDVKSTVDLNTWTDEDITDSESIAVVYDLATDGRTVWVVVDDGLHTFDTGASSPTWTHYADNPAGHYYTNIWFAKGRLIAATENGQLYNITASGAAPVSSLIDSGSDWTSVTGGTGHIYAATNRTIYRTAVKADGTSLDAPIVAGELPEGETIESIYGYLGFVLIGTDEGFRLATSDAEGNLTIGALVNLHAPVYTFLGHGQYVYFNMDYIDTTSSGLGRMDLTTFNDSAPAYASDLRVEGVVDSVFTIIDLNGCLVFGVWGNGIYRQHNNQAVASGYIDSGRIGYGIPDPKIALRLALKHRPLPEDSYVEMYVSTDDSDFVSVGTSSEEDSSSPALPFKVPELAAQLFEVRTVLGGYAELERYDLRAWPVSSRGKTILAPIVLYETVTDAHGAEHHMDVPAEYALVEQYENSGRLISYQELGIAYSVFVEELSFQRHHATADRSWWNGTLLAKLKVLGE